MLDRSDGKSDGGQKERSEKGGGAPHLPDRLLGEVRTGEIDGVREEE